MKKRTVRAGPRLLRTTLLTGAGALLCVQWHAPAHAAWPPPSDATPADMRSPTNWPDDPLYWYAASPDPTEREDGQWQLYSFIPEQSLRTRLIRTGESASGASVDLAWRETIGTIGKDRVRIAVLGSGILWHEPDLVEKVYLNLGELRSHPPPLSEAGEPCAPLDPENPTEDLFDCHGDGIHGDGILTVADYAHHPLLEPEATEVPCDEGTCVRPKGDANENGILDAGDLILQFSDGVDNDDNGYVDDIAGWDFLKDDNNPYDDTRAGYGTRRALEAAAETHNGLGGAGVCPKCRVIPVRVGDSYVVDAQRFAKGVVYATDQQAQVVLAALRGVNMSSFAQEAIDYAWNNGSLVVAALGDDGSRAHSVPATANHTLAVHAVTMAGASPQSTTTTSFLAASPCSNFGAQNLLSAPSSGSSRPAAGYAAGIAGLLYSMALGQEQGEAPLSLEAGEVRQLLLMTADDVDISQSREEASSSYWSQAGFEQRFGYGRANANRAIEWIREGRIPPNIDLVAPGWFRVLYADQVTAPVPIRGTVSAERAESYDYWVEWAPGVQPLEGAFTVIKHVPDVPFNEVSGGDGGPLAELDIRALDISHERDVDSPGGENDFTITVRVRALAHYGDEIGDVPGELRRAFAVHQDPDLLSGFPIFLGASGESSPKLADIDGDGVRDIVVATGDGELHVLSAVGSRPTELEGFPFAVRQVAGLDGLAERAARCGSVLPQASCFDYRRAPAYSATEGVDLELANESIVATSAIADLNGDGSLDIVVTTYDGTLYVVGSDGAVLQGWPRRLPEVPACPTDDSEAPDFCLDSSARVQRGALASPVLADLDRDGELEIIQAALDGQVHVLEADGSTLDGWPVPVHYATEDIEATHGPITSTPAVADFDGDGVLDVLVGSNESFGVGGDQGAFYLVDGRGQQTDASAYLSHWPVTVSSFKFVPLLAEGAANSPIAADFDGDGIPEAALHGNGGDPFILPADPGLQTPSGALPTEALPERQDPATGQLSRGLEPTLRFGADSRAERVDTMSPLFAQPSAGDLNQDGVPDLVTAGTYLDVARSLNTCTAPTEPSTYLLGMWDGRTGAMLPGSPVPIEDFSLLGNQAIADVSGDGYPEVLMGSAGYFLHAVDACGREPEGWPKFTGQWLWATPAVGDIDGDEDLDVVAVSRTGWLFAWTTEGRSDGVIAWESFHHDNRNTGNLSVPLEQGQPLGAAGPLPLDEQGRCLLPEEAEEVAEAPQKLTPAGGCGCRLPARQPHSPWLLALGLPAAAALRRRLRRRRHHGA